MCIPSYSFAEEVFTTNLGLGSAGPAVSKLQAFLLEEGYSEVGAPGVFDRKLESVIARFQIKNGVSPAVGYFGPKTRAVVQNILKNRSILAEIKRLQGILAALLKQIETSKLPAEIEPRSIVGLNCYAKKTDGTMFNYGKGSGVVVREDGLILTVRHLVDLSYSYGVDSQSVLDRSLLTSVFSHCTVGLIPEGAVLPTPENIRKTNPFIEVPFSPYVATLVFKPTEGGLSPTEADYLDFALLKISGLAPDASVFGTTSTPATFKRAAIIPSGLRPKQDEDVITYGYPADMGDILRASFERLYLVGGVGRIKALAQGDREFVGIPFVINTNMEVRGGRSGSPLFSSGQVIGIVSAHSKENVFDSFSVSIEAIRASLRGSAFSF